MQDRGPSRELGLVVGCTAVATLALCWFIVSSVATISKLNAINDKVQAQLDASYRQREVNTAKIRDQIGALQRVNALLARKAGVSPEQIEAASAKPSNVQPR